MLERSDTIDNLPPLLNLPFEIRDLIWGFCKPELVMLKMQRPWSNSTEWNKHMPGVYDPSLKLPISPLLLVNRQINKEAYSLVHQKVRLYCEFLPGSLLLYGISIKQRSFISELEGFCLIRRDASLEAKKESYMRIALSAIEWMWSKFDISIGEVPDSGTPGPVDTWVHTSWKVVVEDAKATQYECTRYGRVRQIAYRRRFWST